MKDRFLYPKTVAPRATQNRLSMRKAMNKNWYNQNANPALNTKAGNK